MARHCFCILPLLPVLASTSCIHPFCIGAHSLVPYLAKMDSRSIYSFSQVFRWTVLVFEGGSPWRPESSLKLLCTSELTPHQISFTNPLKKFKSSFLKCKVCTLLLAFLTPLRILSSTFSWLLQSRLPLITTSSVIHCSWGIDTTSP